MTRLLDKVDGEFFRTLRPIRRGRVHYLQDYRRFSSIVGSHFTDSSRENTRLTRRFFEGVLQDFVDNRLEYREEPIVATTDMILAHLPDSVLVSKNSPLKQYFIDHTENFKADLAEWIYDAFLHEVCSDIQEFMGSRTWNVYLVSFDTYALNIEQYEDFRIHYFNSYIYRGKHEKRTHSYFDRRS